jgi:hypothetical protein
MKAEEYVIKAGDILTSLYTKRLDTSEEIALYKEHLRLIRKTAYAGNGEAQFMLGQHYEDINY